MSKPALQISITDPELQAYLQRHPFASGPDAGKNQRGREAIVTKLAARQPAPATQPRMLPLEGSGLPAEEQARADRMIDQIGRSNMHDIYRDDFAWEMNLIPRDKKNILVIGCGDGVELIYLRSILPEARITGIDYYRSLLPGLYEAVGLTHLEGDMNRHLQSLSREYDLVYSNHTLEHLYEPDRLLQLLGSLLVSGGHLCSTLPMTGTEGMPFLERARHVAQVHQIHPIDLPLLDAGHPWKTNPADLRQTLEQAGFIDVHVYQREGHLSRPLRCSTENYRRGREKAVSLNRAVLGPIRTGLKLVFPKRMPDKVAKLFFALERRLPFGTNRVMNNYSEEACVIGRIA